MSKHTQPCHSTPVSTTKSQLQPFDQNYTLTGLIKDIQVSINQLLKSKKNHQEQGQTEFQKEIHILEKVQEEVGILKVIIAHNINSIFSSIYPSHMVSKSENSTNHEDSNKKRNQEEFLNKSMTISDFNIEGNYKINSLQVSKENLAYYQKRYSEEKHNEEGLLEGKKASSKKKSSGESIRIEEAHEEEEEERKGVREEAMDLICHEDERTIIINKRRNHAQEIKEAHFSPIEQRPVEQEYSMEKGGYVEQNKENKDINLMFDKNRQNLCIKIGRNQSLELKKSLFSQKSQPFKRISHRKFNYLEQLNKY